MTTSPYKPAVKVEIAFNSGYATPTGSRIWTDVSEWVEPNQGEIGIRHGRQDERSTSDANELTLTLDNRDGRFTYGRAASPYYPDVKVGRPIRVTTTFPENYVTNPTFETDISGWSGLFGATPTRSTAQAWQGAASCLITWPTIAAQGATVFATVTGLTVGQVYTLSAYVYVPASQPRVRLKQDSTLSSLSTLTATWERLTLTFTATATSEAVEVINADAATAGQTAYFDGVMVNIGASVVDFTSAVTAPSVRNTGYINEWPVEWDGTDATAYCTITASSRLARIGLSQQLRSVVEEEILRDMPTPDGNTVHHYYTLGDPEGSTVASESSGSDAANAAQIGNGTAVVFGNGVGPGTDGLPAATFAGGRYLHAEPSHSAAVSLTLEAFIVTSTVPPFNPNSMVIASVWSTIGNVAQLAMNGDGKIIAKGFNGTTTAAAGANLADGLLHHVALTTARSLSQSDLIVYVDGFEIANVTGGAGLTSSTFTDFYIGGDRKDPIEPVPFTGTLAHVCFTDDTFLSATRVAAHNQAGKDGFVGDLPGTRIIRYAAYAGIPEAEIFLDLGTPPIAHVEITGMTPLDALRLVELTEGGVLFDGRDGTLGFNDRSSRYNTAASFTLSMASQQIENGYAPKADRSVLLNDVTASTHDGAVAARFVAHDSVEDHGPHQESVELATTDVNEPHAAASARVNAYSEPTARVPSVDVDLLALPGDTRAAIMAADIGAVVTVTGHPSQAATSSASYFIEGWTETIGGDSYTLSLNVSPAEPWLSIFTIEGGSKGALDGGNHIAY